MGIKSLNKFLKKNSEDAFVLTDLSKYYLKKIAIDISLYLYKYKTIYGENWISAFINLISCLRKNYIHCVFCYDTNSPPEKEKEKESRKIQKEKLRNKIFKLEEGIDLYYKTNEITEFLQEIHSKKFPPQKLELTKQIRNIPFNIKNIENEYNKVKRQDVSLTKEDIKLTKELFDILSVPYLDAEFEAETLCSQLCIEGYVEGVLSEDTDVLAYGSPLFLTKIDISKNTCVELNLSKILKNLELNYEEFRDLCIMCGTDYNSNIFKVGPEGSFKLIKKYSNIDNIGENTEYDISILNHKRVRELFKFNKKWDNKIFHCGEPDLPKLEKFILQNNCKINLLNVREAFSSKKVIFIDD